MVLCAGEATTTASNRERDRLLAFAMVCGYFLSQGGRLLKKCVCVSAGGARGLGGWVRDGRGLGAGLRPRHRGLSLARAQRGPRRLSRAQIPAHERAALALRRRARPCRAFERPDEKRRLVSREYTKLIREILALSPKTTPTRASLYIWSKAGVVKSAAISLEGVRSVFLKRAYLHRT